jgi:hypothetical protein
MRLFRLWKDIVLGRYPKPRTQNPSLTKAEKPTLSQHFSTTHGFGKPAVLPRGEPKTMADKAIKSVEKIGQK